MLLSLFIIFKNIMCSNAMLCGLNVGLILIFKELTMELKSTLCSP
jgi:hypothetical protein